MARNTNIKLRRSATAGAIPTTSNLDLGELALNTYDGKLYAKTTEGSASEVIQVGSATDSYHKIRKSQTLTFTVTVASKTSDHAHHGSGSSSAYFIDGLQSPHLHLVPGNTYRFDQSDSSNSGHPLRFYYEADKTGNYTTGVTTNGTAGSSGAYTQIVVSDSTPMVLHYQCSAHGYMGGRADFSTRNFTGFDTDDLIQGSSNLYFTDTRARAAISAGTGISYNSSTGVISSSITQYSNSDVESYLDSNGITMPDNVLVTVGSGNDFDFFHDGTDSRIRNATGDIVILNNANDKDILLQSDDGSGGVATYLTIDGSATKVILNKDTKMADNIELQLGNDNDFVLKHNATNSVISTDTGDLVLLNNADDKDIVFKSDDGSGGTTEYLRLDGSLGYTVSSKHILFNDDVKARFGNSADLEIYHDGANNYIDTSTGSLLLRNTNDDYHVIIQSDNGGGGLADYFRAKGDTGEAILYHYGNEKLKTSSSGASITGNLTVSGDLTISGTTTTLNTATLDVEDKNITINKGSGDTSSSANGAGITIQDAVNASTDATLLWDASDDEFDFSHAITAPGATIASLTYPSSDGSSGQALVTDGSGNLSFSSISAGGNAFGTIAVSGQSNVAADSNSDTLTFVAGSNITLTTNAGNDSVTIASSGGALTVQEEGSSLSTAATTLNFVGSGVTATGSGATKTITVSGGEITVQDEGSALSTAAQTLNFVGAGVTATGSGATKTVTIPGGGGEVFKTIAVSGSSDIVADSATDTLTLVAGSGMTITNNASTDTITFASTGASSQSGVLTQFLFTPSSSTTTFTGSDANSSTLSYTVGSIDVFLNGVKLRDTTDFTATNGSSVVLVNAAGSGDVLQINAYTQVLGFGDSNLSELTGDGSTTAFTIAANPNNENNTQVYIDGVYQEKATYSVSGTTLTFSTAPGNGASIEVVIGSRNVTIDDVSGLTVNGDTSITGNLDIASKIRHIGDTDNYIHFSAADTQSYVTGNSTRMQIANSLVRFNQENNNQDFAVFSSSNDDMLYVDASADGVGIGTNTPASVLHVKTAVDNSLTQGLVIERSANTDRGYINYQGGAFQIRSTVGDPIAFGETDAEHLRIAPDGNVGIGTSSPAVGLDIGSKTDAIRVPNGTTAQRPTAATGQLRYNTTTSEFEGYSGSSWGAIGGGGDAFGTIAVSGQSNVVADQENDTLTLVAGNGMTITTAAGSDTITLASNTSINPFTTDFFTTSNASTTAFTLSVTPPSEDNLIVFLEGVYQNKNSYSLSGTTLTLDSAPASGAEVVVHIIQNGVVGAGHTVDEFTGDGSDTTFTLSVAPMNENNTFVYLDGVYQEKSVYSVSGTTLTFATAPVSGHSIEVVTPQVTEINQPATDSINAIGMFDDTTMMGSTVTSTTMTTTSATTIATHAAATYRTVKYLVQLTQGTDYHSTEINLIHDGSTVYITEYGTLFDNAVLGTLNATISSGNILLQLTPGSNSSLTARVVSTAIPV